MDELWEALAQWKALWQLWDIWLEDTAVQLPGASLQETMMEGRDAGFSDAATVLHENGPSALPSDAALPPLALLYRQEPSAFEAMEPLENLTEPLQMPSLEDASQSVFFQTGGNDGMDSQEDGRVLRGVTGASFYDRKALSMVGRQTLEAPHLPSVQGLGRTTAVYGRGAAVPLPVEGEAGSLVVGQTGMQVLQTQDPAQGQERHVQVQDPIPSVTVQVYGLTVREEADVDRVAEALWHKLRLAASGVG